MNSTIANADPVGGICDVLSNHQMRILQCEWQMIHEKSVRTNSTASLVWLKVD
jgi:hypothetical protein